MAKLEGKDILEFLLKKFKAYKASKDKSIIGLDIGITSIRMIQFKNNKKKHNSIEKYSSVSMPEGVIIEDEIHDRDILVNKIQEVYQQGGFKAKNVCFGVWGANTMVRKVQIPAPELDDDLYDHVVWETEQYIPFKIEDTFVSFHELGINEGGGIDLILAAVKKNILNQFKDVIVEAGLYPKIVDHGALAFANTITTIMPEVIENEEAIAICEIGAQKTFLHIFKKNELNFYKELPIGGQMVTEEIQRQMGITLQEADDLKINGDGSGKIPEEISAITQDVLNVFGDELSDVIEVYKTSMSEDSLREIVCIGKTLKLQGCKEAIERKTGLSVVNLNINEKLNFDNSLSEENIEDISSSFGVIGLGLRQFDD